MGANGGVALIHKCGLHFSPLALLGTSLALMALSAALLLLVGFGVLRNPLDGKLLTRMWWGTMVCFYLFNFAQVRASRALTRLPSASLTRWVARRLTSGCS